MQTINAPAINDHRGFFSKLPLDNETTGSGNFSLKRLAVFNRQGSGRLVKSGQRKTAKGVMSLALVYLLLTVLLCCVFQQKAFAEHKLSDNLIIKEFHEKKYSLYFDKERRQLQVNGIMEIGILPAFEKMLSKHPELTEVVFNSSRR